MQIALSGALQMTLRHPAFPHRKLVPHTGQLDRIGGPDGLESLKEPSSFGSNEVGTDEG